MKQLLSDLIWICRSRVRQVAWAMAAILALGTARPGLAQDAAGPGTISGGLGYFSIGYKQPRLSALNSVLTNGGFAAVPSGYLTVGGGGHSIIKNVVIGGAGHSFSGKNSQATQGGRALETAFYGGYGFFNIGYVLLTKKAMLLYPMLGLGGGGMTVELSDAPQSNTFQDMLQNHQRGVKLESGGFLLNLQLASDFFLHGNERGRGGLLVGVHAGYIYAPTKWDNWTWQNTRIANGPDARLSGPYVRLTFGAGGYGRGRSN